MKNPTDLYEDKEFMCRFKGTVTPNVLYKIIEEWEDIGPDDYDEYSILKAGFVFGEPSKEDPLAQYNMYLVKYRLYDMKPFKVYPNNGVRVVTGFDI